MVEMFVPGTAVGLIIGKGGETIRRLEAEAHCRIQIAPGTLSAQCKVRPTRVSRSRRHCTVVRWEAAGARRQYVGCGAPRRYLGRAGQCGTR